MGYCEEIRTVTGVLVMVILAENVLEVECVISTVAETDTTDYYVVTKLEISLSLDHRVPSLSQHGIS